MHRQSARARRRDPCARQDGRPRERVLASVREMTVGPRPGYDSSAPPSYGGVHVTCPIAVGRGWPGPALRRTDPCGCSSVVERQLPKLNVAGSTPVTRFKPLPINALCEPAARSSAPACERSHRQSRESMDIWRAHVRLAGCLFVRNDRTKGRSAVGDAVGRGPRGRAAPNGCRGTTSIRDVPAHVVTVTLGSPVKSSRHLCE